MKILLLVIVTLLTGCMGKPFFVDERFSPEEEAQIQWGADSWAAIGAEPIDFIWRQRVDVSDTGRRVVVRVHDKLALQTSQKFSEGCVAVEQYGLGYERIVVDVDRMTTEDMGMYLSHEFGHHYLGPQHSNEPDSIMNLSSTVRGPGPSDRKALVLAREPGL